MIRDSYEALRPHVTEPSMQEAVPYDGARELYENTATNVNATGNPADQTVFMLSHYSNYMQDVPQEEPAAASEEQRYTYEPYAAANDDRDPNYFEYER